MGGKSDYLELELLDHVLGNASYSAPATVYIALCESAPTDASTGSTIDEPESGEYVNYARVAVTNNATNWPAAAAGAKSNGTTITFPTAGGASTGCTVTHFAICDASTAGNVLYWGDLSPSRAIAANQVPSFAVGDLDVTED